MSEPEEKGFKFTPAWLVIGLALGGFGILVAPEFFGADEEERPDRFLVDLADGGSDHARSATPIAAAGYRIQESDPVPGGVLRLLLSSPEGPSRLCWATFGEGQEALGRIECGEAPEGQLTSAADPIPGAFASESTSPDARLTLWNGSVVTREPVEHAFVYAHDRAVILGPEHRVHWIGENVSLRSDYSAHLVWDAVLVHEVTETSGALFEQEPPTAGSEAVPVAPNEPVPIGAVISDVERFRGCRTPAALTVIVEGAISHGLRPSSVTMRTQSGWSTPVETTFAVPTPQVACIGEEVVITWLEVTDPSVEQLNLHQTRCTPTACTTGHSTLRVAGFDPVASALVDKVVLMYGNDRGTRVRVSSFDDPDEGIVLDLHPPEWRVLARHLFVRRGVAVAVIRTTHGLFAFRIERDGTVRALSAHPLRESGQL